MSPGISWADRNPTTRSSDRIINIVLFILYLLEIDITLIRGTAYYCETGFGNRVRIIFIENHTIFGLDSI
jgi:hypothetical protein